MLRALGSASSDITHEPGVTISCDIRHETGIRFVTGIGITHETGGTICYGHWVLRLVISHSRDRGYDLLRAFGSASCDITHETGGTICYGHWAPCLVILHTRQEVRFVTSIGFCVL